MTHSDEAMRAAIIAYYYADLERFPTRYHAAVAAYDRVVKEQAEKLDKPGRQERWRSGCHESVWRERDS